VPDDVLLMPIVCVLGLILFGGLVWGSFGDAIVFLPGDGRVAGVEFLLMMVDPPFG
jgi:hypothetical protein